MDDINEIPAGQMSADGEETLPVFTEEDYIADIIATIKSDIEDKVERGDGVKNGSTMTVQDYFSERPGDWRARGHVVGEVRWKTGGGVLVPKTKQKCVWRFELSDEVKAFSDQLLEAAEKEGIKLAGPYLAVHSYGRCIFPFAAQESTDGKWYQGDIGSVKEPFSFMGQVQSTDILRGEKTEFESSDWEWREKTSCYYATVGWSYIVEKEIEGDA